MNFNSDNIKPALVFDGSWNQLHGTVSGATHTPAWGINGGGVYDFDWVDDYIELNDGMNIKTLSVAAKEANMTGLTFSTDWIYAYIVWDVSDQVHQYTLSTAWEVTTGVFTRSQSIAWQDILPTSLRFSVDGTKMYLLGDTWNDITYYTLSTAWDISTLAYVGEFAVGNGEIAPNGLFIRADWLKFYVVGSTNDTVYQYSMSAWDMSTASYDSISLSVTAQETLPQGLWFKDDGTEMYLLGSTGDDITVYTLGTAWNVSTGTPSGVTFYVGTQDTTPADIFIGDSGRKLYIAWYQTDTIYQYNLYSAYSFSNPIYSNGFTIIADIKADTAWEALFGRILDKSYWGNGEGWYYWTVSNNQNHTFTINNGTAISATASSVPFASTKRVAVTVTSAWAVTMYVNGASAWTWTTTTPDKITVPTASRIGNYALGTTRTFDWYIGNVRIFSRVLTTAEILADYTALWDARDFTWIPHLTTAMRDSIVSPPNPYQIFNLTTWVIETWNGSAWV